MAFIKWCERVNELLIRKHGKTIADFEVNQAKAAWDYDETPEEFVSWVEDRFDL
jgi:hypothetical protein